ncbi:ABC transporter permease [Actinomadura sp. WMMA1423]|uniref:ABC transporter permease n=1 Tax=Actinomadura sp. WMMA1423 TaxID=2591108 RepID=UPI001146CEED|nr:ABC transporter permease [Actinomadura sp. WMMA1423]
MLAYLRLEGTRLYRDVSFLAVSLITPLLMYFVLGNSAKGPDREETLLLLTVTMAAFGAMGAVLNSGSGIAEDKSLGWLRQLRLTPLSPARVVVGRGLVGLVVALPPILAIQLVGALVDHVRHTPAEWAGSVAALWTGVAPIALLAIGLGYLLRPQIAQGVAVVSYIAMSLVGGLWQPVDKLPGWLQPVSRATPTYRYAQFADDLATGHAPHAQGAAILAGWTAIAAVFALLAYRKGAETR